MRDMSILINYFGLSQIRAAEAVKIKYEISVSTSTLKKYFFEYFGDHARPVLSNSEHVTTLNEYERTKFVSSFPVSARKFFNK